MSVEIVCDRFYVNNVKQKWLGSDDLLAWTTFSSTCSFKVERECTEVSAVAWLFSECQKTSIGYCEHCIQGMKTDCKIHLIIFSQEDNSKSSELFA
ncbi:hypothetical protein GJAV_G00209070 [Gymnothorax javanicus]|nr:hypothetical protein GJAV_G00209070 [Gymnothorax javanicus]